MSKVRKKKQTTVVMSPQDRGKGNLPCDARIVRVIVETLRKGESRTSVARILGIPVTTLNNWLCKTAKAAQPTLIAAVEKIKCDRGVELSFLKRCKGYQYTEATMGPAGKHCKAKKHMPADVRAMMFYLKNRDPQRWRDNVVMDPGGLPLIKMRLAEGAGEAAIEDVAVP